MGKAYQHRDQFRGQDEAGKAAWLWRILAETLANAARELAPEVLMA
jgi:hypothetical protein